MGRNHVDEDELLSDTVEYERLDVSPLARVYQTTNEKEDISSKLTLMRQDNYVSTDYNLLVVLRVL